MLHVSLAKVTCPAVCLFCIYEQFTSSGFIKIDSVLQRGKIACESTTVLDLFFIFVVVILIIAVIAT